MDRITPQVTITDIRTVRQADTSVFDAIITVCQENVRDSITDDSVVYSQHELADGVRDEIRGGECTFAVFETAADDLRESLIGDRDTLIHCHAGVSRSVSVTAAVLSVVHGQTVGDSLEQIQRERERARPIARLRDYAKLYTYIHGDEQSIDDIPSEHRPPEFTGFS